MSTLRFDDKVAVVTGAGGGLGRSHALLLASRGAKVVVNDLGGSAFGDGKSATPADKVVAEIVEAGGTAVANYDSVEDGQRIIETAMDTYGRVDIVINNAGILRDVSFHKMTAEDWDLVYRVHVKGSFAVTHAAWPHLREQHYGRVIMTASAAGIYGNFGQANYAMAKLGLTGFANTLAVEGIGRGIHVNTIAPLAGSRLTETVLPKDLTDALQPEVVSPLVGWLCHEDCEENGGLYEVGGGFFAKLRWERAAGKQYRAGRSISPEDVKANWQVIGGFEDTTHPGSVAESMGPIIENVNAGKSRGGNEYIDVDAAMDHVFDSVHSSYDGSDLSLYALGVGAGANPLDEKELELVYELHGEGMKALPSYGVIPAVNSFLKMAQEGKLADGFNFGLDRILHGEQRLKLERPLPKQAKLRHETKVTDVFDKGKHAFITLEVKSYEDDGDLLCTNEIVLVVRGVGGWGGERGTSEERNPIPDRAPDATRTEKISEQQALLYRLSGDWNPLHADPNFAKAVGFERPILHGLCTYGYACRHVVDAMADGNPQKIAAFEARMSKSVFPGDTLTTEMWKDGDKVAFRSKVEGRDGYVLTSGGAQIWDEIPQKKAKVEVATQAADKAPAKAEPVAQDVFTAIGGYLADNAGEVSKIGKVFQFRLRDPAQVYTIDLKSVPAKVINGEEPKPDTTLELTDADFLLMCAGTKDAMKMYMDGELKIGGDLMASQKLTFLQKIEPDRVYAAAAARSGGSATPTAKAEPDSRAVFAAIDAYVKKHPELAEKIQTVYAFELTNPDRSFTLDLKNAPGSASVGAPDKAECTLKLEDATFMAMTRGEADPTKLFMDGKLKVSGNIMASQKLTFLTEIDPAEVEAAATEAPAEEAPATASREALAATVFGALEKRLKETPGLADEVREVLQFRLTDPDAVFAVNLTKGPGSVTTGEVDNAKATFTLSDEDLAALVRQEESPQSLYQHGRLRVDGDIALAQRLGFLKNLV